MAPRTSRLAVAAIAAAVLVGGVAAAVTVAPRLVSGSATPTTALGPPRFDDETASAGIDHVYDGGSPFAVGGGVATFDCNGDGRPDAYLAGGSGPAALYRNDSPVGAALAFTPLHDAATDLADVTGAYPLDIDGDGNVDLAVLREGGNVLLRGTGDCRFARANEAWSFDGGKELTTAFSATWEAGSNLPTLAFGNYLRVDTTGETTFDCVDNAFVRPSPTGVGFGHPVALSPGYCSLSMLFSDWDRSGRRDLRVSNDRQYYTDGEEQLFRIEAGQPPRAYTADDGWVSMQIWGMGIASYDLTEDGYPEVYLTSQGDNKLQTLAAGPSQPRFRDIALRRGITATRPFTGDVNLPSTAWHPEFEDVNDDGFVDLFVTKGNVGHQPDYAMRDATDLFLGQPDGTFAEAADRAGILNVAHGRGAAVVDLNLDGLPDVIEVNLGDPVRVWRNIGGGTPDRPGPMGNWIDVRVTQLGPNVDAIGGWLEVRIGDVTRRRELVVGGGHEGGELGWTHFGLGPASKVDVRVVWPDGKAGAWSPVDANQFLMIDRSAAAPQVWKP